MKSKQIPYDPKLKEYARQLRKNSTLSEVLMWQNIKGKVHGVEFHRQVPLLHYIVDFYCHEIGLAIEIDGNSHDFKYNYDVFRQGKMEAYGIHFLRFTDIEVKKEMTNVILQLENKIKELTGRE